MSKDFLSRWSRRKQAAQAAEQAKRPPGAESAAVPEHGAEPAAPESRDASGAAQSAPQSRAPAFDPLSLPPLESITAETDIRAFFADGVPAELTRAVLRRVWTSDPKIRDFVGLADYDWDFNAPGAMAGFGPLEGTDALRAEMARRLGPVIAEGDPAEMSGPAPGAQHEASASNAPVRDRSAQTGRIMNEDGPLQKVGAAPEGDGPDAEYAAAQQQQEEPEDVQPIARRRHGRALPEA